MNRIVYNAALLVGMGLVGAGVGLELGVPRALQVSGGLVLVLTLVGAWIGSR